MSIHVLRMLSGVVHSPPRTPRSATVRPRNEAEPRAASTVTMVRRLKDDIPPLPDGTPRFPERVLDRLEVDYTEEERQAHQDLERFFELRAKSQESAAGHFATEFMHKLLKKRLYSSPQAFHSTLEKHAHTLRHGKSDHRIPRHPKLALPVACTSRPCRAGKARDHVRRHGR